MKYLLLSIVFVPFFVFYFVDYDYSIAAHKMPIEPIAPDYSSHINTYPYLDSFENFILEGMENEGLPGAAIVIVKDSSIIYCKGIGKRNAETGDTINKHTIFRIGSVSKTFGALVASMLVKQGYFNWDDKVVDYLPYFKLKDPEQTKRVTIRHLLSHTVGLPRHSYTDRIERGESIAEIASTFDQVELPGKEGEFYAYQNATFAMIEEIIFATTHKTYREHLQSLLFDPLNMHHSSVTYNQIIDDRNHALPHFLFNSGWKPQPITAKYYNAASAGGINTSAEDMGVYLKLLMGAYPEIVSNETLSTLFKPAVKTTHEKKYYHNWQNLHSDYYGLGWRILPYANDTLIHHGGYVNGFRSELAFSKKEKVGIFIVFNSPSHLASSCVPEFFDRYYAFCELNKKNIGQQVVQLNSSLVHQIENAEGYKN